MTQQLSHFLNGPSHTAIEPTLLLAKKGIVVLSDKLYSPDPSPSDYFLSPKLKFTLKGD